MKMKSAGRKDWRVAMMALVLAASVGPVLAGNDACKATTKAAAKACAAEAKSDLAIALGKCANVPDATERKACQQEAKAEFKDALGECKDQAEARSVACDKLGRDPYDPVINPANFVDAITNPFLPLAPGTTFVYVSPSESNVVAVTHNTKVILGVTCVEVHDTVYVNGELTEDTLDWFAQDTAGNVWYFGENTHELEGDEITSIDGSFKAGVNGAKPGIIMKANPMVGDFYRQEFDLGNAEDNAEVTGLNESVSVPAGDFEGCVKTDETTPLEPDALENKFYAPGVGFVLQIDVETGERLELVLMTTE